MHRVAITGIGIVSCLGSDIRTVSEALQQGRSGIAVDEERKAMGFRSPLSGIIPDFDPKDILPRKHRKTMPDFSVQAYAAVMDALKMARLTEKDIQNEETGLVFGCDSSSQAAVNQVDLLRKYGETKLIGSGWIFRSMTSNITMNLNTILGTQGASWTISSACSSGGHAIGQAADLVAYGRQKRMICGGAQEVNWESVCSFDGIGAFSCRTQDPKAASRPFDIERDGLVPSGGAAALVLERLDLARERGAPVLGEILAYAFSSDGEYISMPNLDGLQRAMRKALAEATMAPSDIQYICAHATSTQEGDAAEAENIYSVFGSRCPWVSSVKSMTGHELWMSGASQVVYSVIMAKDGFIAPNINFRAPDEHTKKLNIVFETIRKPPETVLCNSAGFGGTNACLVIGFDT
ncbi:MAG: beta-ketoacyl synthase [Deltaproteobacteria bacterium RBG_13_49_15]|nr:MAG: beta-ketoacyl synthase [Deltaproteobacteria bacterium RBG_13_49_15]